MIAAWLPFTCPRCHLLWITLDVVERDAKRAIEITDLVKAT